VLAVAQVAGRLLDRGVVAVTHEAFPAPPGLLVGRGRGCFAAGLKPVPGVDE
jgi:hypothetical protein